MADEKDDVSGLVERAFLLGLGVMEITRERMTNLTNDLVERGKMSQSEAKRVTDRLGEIAEEQHEHAREAVDRGSDRFFKATGVATREDVESLKAEIAELKAMIAERPVQAEGEEDTP